jgi:hypothetical protein
MLVGNQPVSAQQVVTLAYAHPAAVQVALVIRAATAKQVMHHGHLSAAQKDRLIDLEQGMAGTHFPTGLPMRLIDRPALILQWTDGLVGWMTLCSSTLAVGGWVRRHPPYGCRSCN